MAATRQPSFCESFLSWREWAIEEFGIRILDGADRIQKFDERHVQPAWMPVANQFLVFNEINMNFLIGALSLIESLIPENSMTRIRQLKAASRLRLQPNNVDLNVGP